MTTNFYKFFFQACLKDCSVYISLFRIVFHIRLSGVLRKYVTWVSETNTSHCLWNSYYVVLAISCLRCPLSIANYLTYYSYSV